jgi:hypothetical protein
MTISIYNNPLFFTGGFVVEIVLLMRSQYILIKHSIPNRVAKVQLIILNANSLKIILRFFY